jgi:hypothetical protein
MPCTSRSGPSRPRFATARPTLSPPRRKPVLRIRWASGVRDVYGLALLLNVLLCAQTQWVRFMRAASDYLLLGMPDVLQVRVLVCLTAHAHAHQRCRPPTPGLGRPRPQRHTRGECTQVPIAPMRRAIGYSHARDAAMGRWPTSPQDPSSRHACCRRPQRCTQRHLTGGSTRGPSWRLSRPSR